MSCTVADCLTRASELQTISDSAVLDTELLLCAALDVSRTWLKTWPEKTLSAEQLGQFEYSFSRRLRGEPIAHILGSRGFWTLELQTDASTLIPRPETELLVELALQLDLPTEARTLDLGTGTGAIILALASENPLWHCTGLDLQTEAVALAGRNAAANHLHQVRLLQSRWFAAVAGERFDLIVSNPPYIAARDPHLTQGDVRFEPASALVSGEDGLDDLREIIAAAPSHLNDGGWLLLEHGYDQEKPVQALLTAAGFAQVRTEYDLNDQPRVSLGQLQRAQ